MLGLIFKFLGGFAALGFGTLLILNFAGVAKPGTISLSTPDVEPCRRAVAAHYTNVQYVEVRWVWHAKAYGWGCFFELEDATTHTIAPMPR